MYFTKIERIPNWKRRNSKLINNSIQQHIIDFYESNVNCAKVEFDEYEYASVYSLYSGVKKAIHTLELPLEIKLVHGEIYIRRID